MSTKLSRTKSDSFYFRLYSYIFPVNSGATPPKAPELSDKDKEKMEKLKTKSKLKMMGKEEREKEKERLKEEKKKV